MRALALVCLLGPAAFADTGAVPLTAAVSLDAANGQPTDEGRYPAWHAADGDAATTWVANGRRLLVGFAPTRLVGVALVPGYGKSPKLWAANRRVHALSYRFYPKPGPGQGHAPPTPWQRAAVEAPARFESVKQATVTLELESPGEVVALELEVTEASPTTSSEDICLSEVRPLARAAPACPAPERYRYVGAVYGTTFELGERLDADFDVIDFSACVAEHEGTGDGTSRFSGKCTPQKGGVRLEGALTQFDGETTSPPQPYRKRLEVRRYGCGIAVIDGHVYRRASD